MRSIVYHHVNMLQTQAFSKIHDKKPSVENTLTYNSTSQQLPNSERMCIFVAQQE